MYIHNTITNLTSDKLYSLISDIIKVTTYTTMPVLTRYTVPIKPKVIPSNLLLPFIKREV